MSATKEDVKIKQECAKQNIDTTAIKEGAFTGAIAGVIDGAKGGVPLAVAEGLAGAALGAAGVMSYQAAKFDECVKKSTQESEKKKDESKKDESKPLILSIPTPPSTPNRPQTAPTKGGAIPTAQIFANRRAFGGTFGFKF